MLYKSNGVISKKSLESIHDEIKFTGCFDNEFIMGIENKHKSIIDFDNFSSGEDLEKKYQKLIV